MTRRFRKHTLVPIGAIAPVAALAFSSSAEPRDSASLAQVTLRVAAMPYGAVILSPAGTEAGSGTPFGRCQHNYPDGECPVRYSAPVNVTLTAEPGAGQTFYRWSTPDCGSGPTCSVSLADGVQPSQVWAVFSPASLTVLTAGNGTVTGANGGIVCDSDKAEPDCSESLAAGTPVPLTATPKTPGAAPVTSVRAVFVARVNPHASYGQYLARIDQPTAGYDQAQLRRRGALFDFRVRIEGFKHRSLLLKWELFDNVSGDEVDQSKDVQITPTNQTNEATWQFWVPILRQKRAYVAVVELLEQKKTHQLKLSSLETKALRSSG